MSSPKDKEPRKENMVKTENGIFFESDLPNKPTTLRESPNQYKSQKDRSFIAIRKKTKALFKKKADKAKMKHIDYMDKIVNEAN